MLEIVIRGTSGAGKSMLAFVIQEHLLRSGIKTTRLLEAGDHSTYLPSLRDARRVVRKLPPIGMRIERVGKGSQ